MTTTDKKFLEEAPDGFDPTMELKWIECDEKQSGNVASYFTVRRKTQPLFMVLCQKYRGAFRDVWVRVPIDES